MYGPIPPGTGKSGCDKDAGDGEGGGGDGDDEDGEGDGKDRGGDYGEDGDGGGFQMIIFFQRCDDHDENVIDRIQDINTQSECQVGSQNL